MCFYGIESMRAEVTITALSSKHSLILPTFLPPSLPSLLPNSPQFELEYSNYNKILS